ncbi:NADP-dependent oxidoreductase domain-containing protein [Mucidula mucida]|nr:NADP-dependent oxidoreductase domain-containing protein [Mucidula mucida]
MPVIGLGTWLSKPGEVEAAVLHALKTGYRHIDAALIYGNQEEIGQALKKTDVPREEIFLTSKMWNNSHRPELVEKTLDLILEQLGTPYLDLYEIHWPVPFKPGDTLEPPSADGTDILIDADSPGIAEIWKAFVKVKNTGKVKSIGVSNFTRTHLQTIIDATGVVPAVNQIEAHPGLQQPELEEYCKARGIALTGYSPLGNNVIGLPRIIDSPQIQEIAQKLGKEPSQVLISWCAQKGMSVIPKSVTPSRIEINFQDFILPDEDFEAVSKIGRENPVRYGVPIAFKPRWNIDVFGLEEEKEAEYKVW